MNPIFKAVGNSILYGLGKLGNTWARAKIVSKNLLNGKYNNIDNTKPGLSLGRRQYIARRFFNWENPNVMYHTPVGKSRFTRNGLIPGKSFDSNEDYLWWSENIPWSTNRTVFSIPKDKAKVVAKGNVSGINKEDAIYPLTKEVPLEELTSYDYNPITYQIEKSIYVNPKAAKARALFANRPYRVPGTLKLDKPIQTVGEVSNRAALTKSAEQMGADGVIFNNVYDNGYSNNQVIFSFKDLIDGITTKKAAGK